MKKILIVATASLFAAGAVIGVVTFAQTQAQNQTAEDILEQPRVAHGKSTLNKLKTIRITSDVTFYNSNNNAFGIAKQVMSIDFKSRSIKAETFQQDKLANVVVINSDGAWAWSIGGRVVTIPADQAKRLKMATMFGPYGLRADVGEKRQEKRSGKKKINVNAGTDAIVSTVASGSGPTEKLATAPNSSTVVDGDELEVEMTDGEMMKMVMNPDSNLVAEQSFNSFDSRPQLFEFADYHDVNGLKVPFETRLSHEGKVTAIERVSLVKLNLPMNKKDFELPQ